MAHVGEAMTKSNLAQLCNVHVNTARRWCNVLYFADLQKLGYSKFQKVFTPAQWHYITDKLICTNNQTTL